MESKALMASAVTAVVVLVATSFVKDYMDTKGEGDHSNTAKIVREVIRDELKMANGDSYGKKLSEISDNQIKIMTRLDTYEQTLRALSDD